MKVTGPKSTTDIKVANKKKINSSDVNFSDFMDESSDNNKVDNPAFIMNANPLFALNLVNNLIDGQSEALERAKKDAKSMLHNLENLRNDLVLGKLSESNLHNLNKLLSRSKEDFNDPNLSGIIDEIELRASVELAKLEKIKSL